MKKDKGVDICTVAPTPIMFNSFKRNDFTILATFVYSYDDVKVISRKDNGIVSAKNLIGRKIGTPAGTTGQFFTEAFLVHNGIPPSEVKVIDIKPSDLPEALNINRVDAIVIWEPHAQRTLQLLGEKAAVIPAADIYRETFNFVILKDLAKKDTEILNQFLRAIIRATEYIKENKEDSQKIVMERLDMDKESMLLLWDDFVFEISLDQSLIVTLEDEARWAIKNNLVKGKEIPNYLDFIYLDALKKVKPEAVGIIH